MHQILRSHARTPVQWLRFATLIGVMAACSPAMPGTARPDTFFSDHLFVWTAGADSTQPDCAGAPAPSQTKYSDMTRYLR
jgi:hypothetical protein